MFGTFPGLGGGGHWMQNLVGQGGSDSHPFQSILGSQGGNAGGFLMQNLKSLGATPSSLADMAAGKQTDKLGALALAAGGQKKDKKPAFSDAKGADYLAGLPDEVRDKLLAHESVDPLEFLVGKRRKKWERDMDSGGMSTILSRMGAGLGKTHSLGKMMEFDDTPREHELALAEYIRSQQTKRFSAIGQSNLGRTTALDRQLEERAARRREYIR